MLSGGLRTGAPAGRGPRPAPEARGERTPKISRRAPFAKGPEAANGTGGRDRRGRNPARVARAWRSAIPCCDRMLGEPRRSLRLATRLALAVRRGFPGDDAIDPLLAGL